jgi:hypothetical protein
MMSNDPAASGMPDPEANRAAWFAAHPEAQPAAPAEAAAQVARQLGAADPGPGVPDAELAGQMAAAGVEAGLPYEDAMNALMDEVRRLSQQVETLQARDRQRESAAIAALGEPILQRYANGVRDKLAALAAANPGGADHFTQPVRAADSLVKAAADAISRGANDLGPVAAIAGQLDRFLTRGHPRTAPGHIRHLDMSAVEYDLEQVIAEMDRLAPGGSNGPGGAIAIAS